MKPTTTIMALLTLTLTTFQTRADNIIEGYAKTLGEDNDNRPFAGVDVTLYQGDRRIQGPIPTETDGRYQFNGVPPGEYTLRYEDGLNMIISSPQPVSKEEGKKFTAVDVFVLPGARSTGIVAALNFRKEASGNPALVKWDLIHLRPELEDHVFNSVAKVMDVDIKDLPKKEELYKIERPSPDDIIRPNRRFDEKLLRDLDKIERGEVERIQRGGIEGKR